MSFTLEQYYSVISMVVSALICIKAPELASEILLFLILQFSFFYLYRSRPYFRIVIFILFSTVFGGVIFRAFSVYMDPETYRYIYIYPINDPLLIKKALQGTLFSFAIIILGFTLVTYFLPKKRYVIDRAKSPNFVNNVNLILIILITLVSLKLFIHVGLGIGLKGQKTKAFIGFLFLLRLIPVELPYLIVTIYLLKYKNEISAAQKMAFLLSGISFVLAVLYTGSKTFIVNFALCIVLYFLFNNIKVRLISFLTGTSVLFALLVISFVTSAVVKFQLIGGDAGIQDTFKFIWLTLGDMDGYSMLGIISSRFSGFDGFLLLEQAKDIDHNMSWDKLKEVYKPVNLIKKIIENIIPGINITPLPSCGQAIGFYIFGYDPNSDVAFGGALGPFASFKLISDFSTTKYYLILFLWGFFTGLYFKYLNRIKDSEICFTLFFYGSFLTLHVLISGNFDLLIALFVIKIVLLFIYGILVLILRSIIKNKTIVE